MQKFSKILFFAFCLTMLAQAGEAFAAPETVFTFTYKGQEFSANNAEFNSWRKPQTIRRPNIFTPDPEPIKDSLLKFIGQTPPKQNISHTYSFDLKPIYAFVKKLEAGINTSTVEAVLNIQDSRVVEFAPPKAGTELDVYKSAFKALEALEARRHETELNVITTNPAQTLGNTNNLGITELIAQGVSNFKGSPNNRRHNIAVGLEKFKGVIIPKGAEFSFNENLGPVEKENGFLPELVIKSTGTVPELGGGLCQVSSTTFRAAILAGLPITQRRNHAYAVQYYAPQGTDATIYPGVIDLKFVNDTPGAIFIWPYLKDKDTLIFDFYGTKDSRKVTVEKPITTDKKEDGSMKASWTREVVGADGKLRTDIFKSIYRSPALYHKTEEFVTAAPTGAPKPTLAPPI